jgi:serine/threonine protein phosphatase PrpC
VIRAYAETHPGLVRPDNQDYYLAMPLKEDEGWLVAVADGIGGAPGGAGASRRVVEILAEAAVATHTVSSLEAAIKRANQELFHFGREHERLAGMGTTITVAQVRPGELLLAHVGDSRAYRLRAGRLERLTRDHAVAAELEAAGQITAQEALVHPQRHVLTRAVGPWRTVRVDLLGVAWHRRDRLLLCTDGLYGLVHEAEIAEILHNKRGDDAVHALLGAALERGGTDNVTVVLVEDDESAGDDASHGG